MGIMSNYSLKLILFSIALWPAAPTYAQESTNLSTSEILHRADSVSTYQDSLLAHTKYKVKEEVIFSELNDQGIIKNSDTVISMLTMDGRNEISRETVYTTRKKKEEKK
jgi:hypothetical protein